MHVVDHRGYLPVAGWQFAPASLGGPGAGGGAGAGGGSGAAPSHIATPAGLGDPAEQHYIYYIDSGVKRPVPITVALAQYCQVKTRLGSRADLTADLQDDVFKRLFRCPAQPKKKLQSGLSQRDDADGWTAPVEFLGYVFNEAVLGMRDMGGTGGRLDRTPPVGHMTRIKHPSGGDVRVRRAAARCRQR